MQSSECRSQNEKHITKAAGLAPSQLWARQNIGHYKWVPAFAGMKRSGGGAGATKETDFGMRCDIETKSMKRSMQEGKGIRSICGIRVSNLCLFIFVFVFVLKHLSLPKTRLLRIRSISTIRGDCLCISFFLSVRNSKFYCSNVQYSLLILSLSGGGRIPI